MKDAAHTSAPQQVVVLQVVVHHMSHITTFGCDVTCELQQCNTCITQPIGCVMLNEIRHQVFGLQHLCELL